MNISQTTVNTLKNFASINGNLVVKAGNQISTISQSRSVLAIAKIEESFPSDFGIYDLNEFLSVLSLIENPSLNFNENFLSIESNSRSEAIKYYFADQSILTAPPEKTISMPTHELQITLKHSDLSRLVKAASVLGHNELSFTNSSKGIKVTTVNSKNSTANTYDLVVETDDVVPDCEFKYIVNIANLKLMPNDYTVSFSIKGISHWKTEGVEYYIALEQNSSFNTGENK
jgi:hypothetical protein